MKRILFAGVVFCTAPVFASEVAAPAIEWRTEAEPAVEVTGLPTPMLQSLAREPGTAVEWVKIFVVRVDAPGAAPMAGAWSVSGGRLRFVPRFPWAAGVRYRAEFRPEHEASIVSLFTAPALRAGPVTSVAAIYPSAGVLPENQLKFYVQFSGAMSRGDIYRHIHLRDATGRDVERPFLEIDEELWDPGLTRVTLLIDPGRIKRGVKPLEDMGPVFEAGKFYTLMIDAAWLDAAGRPLRTSYAKTFRAAPADRTPPNPAAWKIAAPRAGTREPLHVIFDEPLDAALALRLIGVAGFDGKAVAGEAELLEQETRWKFTPAQAWMRGPHALRIGATLEDLAGNNPGKVFDVDLFERVERHITTETVSVPFEVK